ncbi:MAG: hypothetical protein IJF17_03335 [Thermoguttaceae bacterium]|nr:hypothetical protein [Thermoguttaceae bacterium]MDO4425656.1 hypothetical protein [Planctomycetia bacterium]
MKKLSGDSISYSLSRQENNHLNSKIKCAVSAEITFPKRSARLVGVEFSGHGWIFASEITIE